MAKLVSFVVCDSITNIPAPQNGTITNLVSPQIALRPQFIPGNFSFGVAVGIADIDLRAENKMRFTIVDPDGGIAHDTGENAFPIIQEPDTLPKEYQGFMVNIDIRNLAVQSEGEYKFVFYINGAFVGEYKVPIYKRVS